MKVEGGGEVALPIFVLSNMLLSLCALTIAPTNTSIRIVVFNTTVYRDGLYNIKGDKRNSLFQFSLRVKFANQHCCLLT